MKQGILIFILVCAMAAAMVPRIRRSQPTEEIKQVNYCEGFTPCAWSIYNPNGKIIEMNLTNSYCICKKPKHCLLYEDDDIGSSYVYRCLVPKS